RWRRIILLLEKWGWSANFAWWGQVTKEANDVDELNYKELQNISYVTPDYFWELAKEEKRNISLSASLLNDENLPSGFHEDWQRWLNSKKYTPNITVHQDEFTFPPIPDSGVIVAVNSGLGTHKTGAMITEIAKTKKGVRIIGYRNNLLLQTASRSASMRDIKVYHLNNDDAKDLVSDESTHLLFCVDSIEHVDGHFAGRDIYLDEACSVLLHTINGGTLGSNQAKVIKIFTRALEVCNRIFLLDGNLSDNYVDFVAKLAKNKQVIKIKNTKKIPPHKISFIEGIDPEGEIKKRDKSALVQYLCSQGVKSWIACDSKTFALTLDKLLLDLGKFGFCLNSESVAEEWAKEFMKEPNLFIQTWQPEYIIVSPTAESGVSVTTKHFTDKMSFFVGVQNTNSQHQQMFRLRDNSIPHYVVCPERSMVKERSTPQTYFDKTFLKILNDRVNVSARMAAFDSGNSDRVLEVIGKALTRNRDDWWDFSGRLGALDNFEMKHLRLCLIHALEEAGHKVEIIEWDTSREYSDLLKGAKEAVQMQHAQELFVAIPLETVEEANQAAKKNPRKPMQRRIEKTRLLDRLPGIESEKAYGIDFIYERHIKNKHFITQQQRFFFLNNFEISQKRHEVDWYYKATAQDFFTGTMKKISHLDIWALKELNILQFTQGEWHKDLSEVNEFIEKARQPEIVKALNMKPDPESATGAEKMKYISSLLDLIGLKFAKPEQKTIDGIRRRVYTVNPEIMNHPDRLAVLAAVERKMTQWMADETKSKVDWSEQAIQQAIVVQNPTQIPVSEPFPKYRDEPLFAPCVWGDRHSKPVDESLINRYTATPLIIYKPDSSVQPESPPESPINPHTVQQGNHDQQPVDISEYMTKESLELIADELENVVTTDDSQGLEILRDIRQCMPPEALKAAAKLLPKPLWTQIAEMVKLQDFPVENQLVEKTMATPAAGIAIDP
ncbi:MAG TPA: plasmid replication protein, CyRepA1 family, partial [Nostoc sp.]|uniref:plasmid replication protein, CyRepA1 family n=1 Tax=Nostoc sp. TaxID=1180 RepID=UPI002D23A268